MPAKEKVVNEAFLKQVIEASCNGKGIVVADSKGTIVLCNAIAQKFFHFEGRVVGRALKTVLPESWPCFHDILKEGIPKRKTKVKVLGKTFLVDITPITAGKKITGMVSLFQDFTELEAMAKELSAYKQMTRELNAIMESSYDGIFITDGNANVLRVNTSWEKITGVRAGEVIGRNMKDLFKEGHVSESVTLLVLKQREPMTISARTKGGKDILFSGNPVFDENGNIDMVVTNVRDMTDLNRLNKQVKQSKRLVRDYITKLEEMRLQHKEVGKVVAESKAMKDIISLALRIAHTDVPVLLQGETGVGKGVIAEIIHQNSSRNKDVFMKIDCAVIPEQLLESELFGYEKGAFTGARETGKKGLFELAEGGSLFLDEIDSLPLNLQGKLLGALQDLKVTRIGGDKPRKIDARIIAASGRNLSQMVAEKIFREDLFYRLNVVPINIPSLRERRADILPLIYFYLEKFNGKYKKNVHFNRSAIDHLIEYRWDGNVRELENLTERLVVTAQQDEIAFGDLPTNIRNFHYDVSDFSDFSRLGVFSLKEAREKFEQYLIDGAVKKYGNARKAARVLRVNPSTITRKMNRGKVPVTKDSQKMPS